MRPDRLKSGPKTEARLDPTKSLSKSLREYEEICLPQVRWFTEIEFAGPPHGDCWFLSSGCHKMVFLDLKCLNFSNFKVSRFHFACFGNFPWVFGRSLLFSVTFWENPVWDPKGNGGAGRRWGKRVVAGFSLSSATLKTTSFLEFS